MQLCSLPHLSWYILKMRIQLIDGLRGYFLLMMMMVHLNSIKPLLFEFNHHKFGYVEDAQGFVFLSGFVIALVYGRLLQRTSFDVMRSSLYKRVQQLYLYNVVCLAIVFALAYSGFKFADQIHDMARIGENGLQDVIISLLLINGPKYVDILPMYICFMLITPFILRALWSDGLIVVISISVGLWAMAQSGVVFLVGNLATDAMNLTADGGFDMTLNFNRWSWQILFVAGLVGGTLFAQGKLDLSRLHERQYRHLFYISLLGIIFFTLMKVALSEEFGLAPGNSDFLQAGLNRENFGILRVTNFVVDAYALVYLLVVGPNSKYRWISIPGRLLRIVLSWRPLVFLGQHSLQVYTLHVVLVYLVAAAVFQFELSAGPGLADIILIGCWALLFVPGLWKKRRLARQETS